MSGEGRYRSLYSASFAEGLDALGGRDYAAVTAAVDLLESTPRLGHDYEPAHGAPEPARPCRVLHVPRCAKALYYEVDDASRELRFVAVLDDRADPRSAFVSR